LAQKAAQTRAKTSKGIPIGPADQGRSSMNRAASFLAKLRRALQIRVVLARVSLFAFAISISSIAICGKAPASGVARQFAEFKAICSIVTIRAEPPLQSQFNFDEINKSVADAIDKRLREQGFAFPVAYGNQCIPGNLDRSPKKLGLFFYTTATDGPTQGSVAFAIILHSFSQGIDFSVHDHPTAIKFCGSDGVQKCLLGHIAAYAEDNVIKTIERVDSLMKGERR